jgi:hypothetical protein
MAAVAPVVVPRPTTKYKRRATPKGAARRTAADQPEHVPTAPGGRGKTSPVIREHLANLANERIRESVLAREGSGIEQEWEDARDLYDGVDNLTKTDTRLRVNDKNSAPRKANQADQDQSTLLLNITKPKTKTAISRVKEMLVPASSVAPFDIDPTPIPELDEVSKKPELAGQNVRLGDGTMAPALAVAEIVRAKSQEAIDGEKKWIEDRFTEGNVYGEMRKMLDNSGLFGTGVMKGPFPVCKKSHEFKISGTIAELIKTTKYEPTSRCIRVQDCYPDPSCGDNIHRGSYFNERDWATAKTLRELAHDPTYDRKAIAQALIEGPIPGKMASAMHMDRSRHRPGNTNQDSKLFELWYSYGDVPAEYLIAMGVKDVLLGNDKDDEAANDPVADELRDQADAEAAFDPDSESEEDRTLSEDEEAALKHVPALVTMLNGRPIKAQIQPLESGRFPYDFFPWEVVEGQPYGKGEPITMRAAQVMVTSGIRRLLENAGQSSGPQLVITDGVIEPVDGKYRITGRKLWRFIPNELISDVNKAMAMFEIPSMQEQLMKIVEFGLVMADRLTNIPMLLQGDESAGDTPDTLGGMKLLVQNSMAPLRDKAKQFDDYFTTPHMGGYHEWFMLHVPDLPKGDAQIKALGSTALIQREEGREFLTMLGPVKNDPAFRINPAKYSAELARANGYDMALIQYTEEEWKTAPENPANAQPQEAPQVAAARIRGETQIASDQARAAALQTELAAKAQMAAEQRAMDRAIADLDHEIAQMELAGKDNISLRDVKAMLAAKAGELNLSRMEMQLKLAPQNTSGTGI